MIAWISLHVNIFHKSDRTFATRVVLASPNGASCCRYAGQVPALLVGALVNARAVAAAVSWVLEQRNDLSVTIIACGERWSMPSEDGALRFAIEDYLGAGAIVSYLSCDKSPEARVCEGAFVQVRDDLEALLWESATGRALRERGFASDIEHAARLNSYETVPIMQKNRLELFDRPQK